MSGQRLSRVTPAAGRESDSRRRRSHLSRCVLLLGHHTAQLVVQRLPVVQVLDLVDSDQPVLRGERLLQVLELDVLVADLGVAGSVEARRRPEVQLRRKEGRR